MTNQGFRNHPAARSSPSTSFIREELLRYTSLCKVTFSSPSLRKRRGNAMGMAPRCSQRQPCPQLGESTRGARSPHPKANRRLRLGIWDLFIGTWSTSSERIPPPTLERVPGEAGCTACSAGRMNVHLHPARTAVPRDREGAEASYTMPHMWAL